jgi:hypothetical protein
MDVVGEIEAARLIEDEVIGSTKGNATTLAIHDLRRARSEVDALDAGFDPIVAKATVVTEVERAVRADGGAVRSTSHERNTFDYAVTADASDTPATDLRDQNAAVVHRDRALREGETVGNDLDLTKFRRRLL